MKKSKSHRFILIIVGILLVLLGIRTLALKIIGKTDTAVVTEVRRAVSQQDDKMDHNYQISYSFTVDGKKYTGSYTKRKVYNTAKLPSVGALVPISYIPKAPMINGGSDTNPIGGILLGGLGILILLLGIKPSGKTTQVVTQESGNDNPQG